MKYDMTGAAAVLAVDRRARRARAARAGHRRGSASPRTCRRARRSGRTTCCASAAARPSRSLNTDAEGRLVLADGLVAASEEQPDAIVDVATLTGAAGRRARAPHRRAHGRRRAGRPRFARLPTRSARRCGRCRCPASCCRCSKSDVADLANAKPGMTVPAACSSPASSCSSSSGTRRGLGRARSRGRTSTSPGRRTTRARRWGFTGTGATGVAVRTLARAGRGALRRVVRSYGRGTSPIPPAAATSRRQSVSLIRCAREIAGCPSRTLTLSSWVAEAVATPRPSAPSSSA